MEPGGLLKHWHLGSESKYLDTGENTQQEYVAGNYDETVLGGNTSYDLRFAEARTFPAQTLFVIEAELRWWIKANGDGGYADVYYALRASPYLEIEACSQEFPETITIRVADYL